MAEVASAYVSILPSAKGFKRALKSQIGDDLKAVGAEGGQELGAGVTAGSTRSLSGVGKKMGRAMLKGGAVAGAAALIMKPLVGAASDAQQSLGATETVFGKTADRIKKKSKSAARAYGLDANTYRESANLIGSLFKNQGVATDKLAGKTDKMIGIGTDLAATFGGTTKDAVDALGAAFKGEYNQLERYGISIKQSTVNTEAMKVANVDSVSAFNKLSTAQQTAAKRQATTNLIMKQGASSRGAFARESDTLAHQQQVLGAQFDNIKVKLGKFLLPLLTKLGKWINTKVLPAVSGFIDGMKDGTGAGGKFVDIMKGLAAAIKWAWDRVIKPAFKALWAFTKNQLIPTLQWLWTKAVKPAFAAISKYVPKVWKQYVAPALSALWRFIQDKVIPTVKFLWSNVVKPVFKFIGKAIKVWWGAAKIIFKAFRAYLRDVLFPVIRFLWHNVVKPVFKGIGKVISGAWHGVIKPAFGFIKSGVHGVKDAFETVRDGIGRIWGGIVSRIKGPINAVLKFIQRYFINPLNSLLDKIPGVSLHIPSVWTKAPPKLTRSGRDSTGNMYASGGVLPGYTPGRDVHDFYSATGGRLHLSGGEAIMRPEWTRAVGGPKAVAAMNARARKGQAFKNGGVLGGFTGSADMDMSTAYYLTHPWAALSKLAGGALKRLIRSLGDNVFTQSAVGVGKAALGGLVAKVKDLFTGTGGAGKGSVGGIGWRRQWAAVQGLGVPGVQMTSNYRAGAITASGYRSYHGLGRAVDLVAPNMMQLFNAIRGKWGGSSKELYYSPAGWRQIQNGHKHYPTGVTRRNHFSHVHWAMQTGGWVPGFGRGDKTPIMGEPGEFMVNRAAATRHAPLLEALNSGAFNGSAASSAASYGSRDEVTVNLHTVNRDVADEAAEALLYALRTRKRGGRY